MQPSPFTSQGSPFSKDWRSYDAVALGETFFNDGVYIPLKSLRLYDHIRLVDGGRASVRHAPYLYGGREVAIYVYTSDQPAQVTDMYERLDLRPVEIGIFACRYAGRVEFRIKLGATLLKLARQPSAEAVRQLRVVRSEARLKGQLWSAGWLLELFAQGGKPLLDPLNVIALDELLKNYNPIISRYEKPEYLRGIGTTRRIAGAIDVEVGLFFDGTSNNRYAAELIYNQVLNKKTGRVDPKKVEAYKEKTELLMHPDLSEVTVEPADFMFDETGSYFNSYSNVVLLHDLYQTQGYDANKPSQPVRFKRYLQGIGTVIELDAQGIPRPDGYKEDDSLGSGIGRDDDGIVARVQQAIALVVAEIFRLRNAHGVVVRSLTFDVFGFSRGAAAARHFINELLRSGNSLKGIPPHGLLGEALTEKTLGIPKSVEVRFAGLFDTVVSTMGAYGSVSESILDDPLGRSKAEYPASYKEPISKSTDMVQKQGEKPFMPPKRIEPEKLYTSMKRLKGKVMHIIAMDEYRENFPLTVSDAPDTYNLYLYGAHSDIGGGYSQMPYNALVRYTDVSVTNEREDLKKVKRMVVSYRQKFTQRVVNGKWVVDTQVSVEPLVTTSSPAIPDKRHIALEKLLTHYTPPITENRAYKKPEKISDHYIVVDRGFISNKLSLVAFNAMLQYALLQKLPFQPEPKKAKVPHPEFYALPQNIPYFTTYYETVEKLVKDPKAETVVFSPEVYRPLYENFVHASSHYNKSIGTYARGVEIGIYPFKPHIETTINQKTKQREEIVVREYRLPAMRKE